MLIAINISLSLALQQVSADVCLWRRRLLARAWAQMKLVLTFVRERTPSHGNVNTKYHYFATYVVMVTCFSSAGKALKWVVRYLRTKSWKYLGNILCEIDWNQVLRCGREAGAWRHRRQIIHRSQDQDISLRSWLRPGNLLRQWMTIAQGSTLHSDTDWMQRKPAKFRALIQMMYKCGHLLNSYYPTFAVSCGAWMDQMLR